MISSSRPRQVDEAAAPPHAPEDDTDADGALVEHAGSPPRLHLVRVLLAALRERLAQTGCRSAGAAPPRRRPRGQHAPRARRRPPAPRSHARGGRALERERALNGAAVVPAEPDEDAMLGGARHRLAKAAAQSFVWFLCWRKSQRTSGTPLRGCGSPNSPRAPRWAALIDARAERGNALVRRDEDAGGAGAVSCQIANHATCRRRRPRRRRGGGRGRRRRAQTRPRGAARGHPSARTTAAAAVGGARRQARELPRQRAGVDLAVEDGGIKPSAEMNGCVVTAPSSTPAEGPVGARLLPWWRRPARPQEGFGGAAPARR